MPKDVGSGDGDSGSGRRQDAFTVLHFLWWQHRCGLQIFGGRWNRQAFDAACRLLGTTPANVGRIFDTNPKPEALGTMSTTTVTLKAPVDIDGKKTTEISLREPKAGELRGVQLVQLMAGDMATLAKVVPRISEPPLTENQIHQMSLSDMTSLYTGLSGFFGDPPKAAGSD